MDFTAEVLLQGKTATGFIVPEDVVTALDAGNRPKVLVTINGYTYASTIAPYGGQILLPLSAENREGAGVAAGDVVTVTVEVDAAPREVEVPADLAAAFRKAKDAKAFFDALSYTHKKEYVRWIEEAKKAETRTTRVEKTVEMLRAGKKTR